MAKRKPTAQEMLVRMAGLCAGAEQCAADIRGKILKQGFPAEEAESMIAYLRENRYLDDNRYARAYAVDKVRFSGWGRMKVRMGLRGKGVGEAVISQALDYIPATDYNESLEKVMAAKARSLDLADVKDRQKLYRHMASRGFESQLIINAMRKLMAKGKGE
ncbi:MAG: RecX family transcriptional regulator [Muribaculaceae bacterium]|nr:RecX family transcriptional regulator [Muribaculaceae bacterium]